MKTLLCATIALAFLLAGCASRPAADRPAEQDQATPPPRDVTANNMDLAIAVALMLEGRFSSAAQAARDERYFEVELRHTRIWDDRDDGVWLYVEQALAGQAPYRRRVYRLTTENPSRVRSDVYVMTDDDRIGPDAGLEAARSGTPADLELRDGCSIMLSDAGAGVWLGGTDGRSCRSTLRGAAYATSEVRLNQNRITTWDRGFDEAGQQVWGAEAGPYEFDRVAP